MNIDNQTEGGRKSKRLKGYKENNVGRGGPIKMLTRKGEKNFNTFLILPGSKGSKD